MQDESGKPTLKRAAMESKVRQKKSGKAVAAVVAPAKENLAKGK